MLRIPNNDHMLTSILTNIVVLDAKLFGSICTVYSICTIFEQYIPFAVHSISVAAGAFFSRGGYAKNNIGPTLRHVAHFSAQYSTTTIKNIVKDQHHQPSLIKIVE